MAVFFLSAFKKVTVLKLNNESSVLVFNYNFAKAMPY